MRPIDAQLLSTSLRYPRNLYRHLLKTTGKITGKTTLSRIHPYPTYSTAPRPQPLGCMRHSVGMSLFTFTSGVLSLHMARVALRVPPSLP